MTTFKLKSFTRKQIPELSKLPCSPLNFMMKAYSENEVNIPTFESLSGLKFEDKVFETKLCVFFEKNGLCFKNESERMVRDLQEEKRRREFSKDNIKFYLSTLSKEELIEKLLNIKNKYDTLREETIKIINIKNEKIEAEKTLNYNLLSQNSGLSMKYIELESSFKEMSKLITSNKVTIKELEDKLIKSNNENFFDNQGKLIKPVSINLSKKLTDCISSKYYCIEKLSLSNEDTERILKKSDFSSKNFENFFNELLESMNYFDICFKDKEVSNKNDSKNPFYLLKKL